MALQLIAPAAIVEFTWSGDKSKEKTTFQARGLRASEMAVIGDLVRVNPDGTIAMNRRQKAVLAFRLAITGWKNLDLVPAWEDTIFGSLLKEDLVERIPFEVLVEIGEKILGAQNLDAESAGN